MSKELKYGAVNCGATGKELKTYGELTAVNWYSKKQGKVVTKFLNLDNQAPEVKAQTDIISNAISALFDMHAESPQVKAYRASIAEDISEDTAVEKANQEVLEMSNPS